MGLKEGKREEEIGVPCTRIFYLAGPKAGACVGYSMETPPHVPKFDTIHICLKSEKNLEEDRDDPDKCHVKNVLHFTAEEAMRMGASLIQAAGFYKAAVDDSLKGGFYKDKWEVKKE